MNLKTKHGKVDWMITLVPLASIIALCVLFLFVPEQSNAILGFDDDILIFVGKTHGN